MTNAILNWLIVNVKRWILSLDRINRKKMDVVSIVARWATETKTIGDHYADGIAAETNAEASTLIIK